MRACLVKRYLTCASSRAKSVRLTTWPMKLLVEATAISLLALV